MTHEPSTLAIVIFTAFVAITLGLSFYLGKQGLAATVATGNDTPKCFAVAVFLANIGLHAARCQGIGGALRIRFDAENPDLYAR